jgi:hypothetical protein
MRPLRWLSVAGVLMATSAMAGEAGLAQLDQWPESWRQAYARFEAYIATHAQYWQPSCLMIQPDGSIQHAVQIYPERTQHLGLDIYQDGCLRLSLSVNKSANVLDQSRLEPGNYFAVLRSASSIGYQYHYPACWFSVLEHPAADSNRVTLSVKVSPPPAEEETFCPNKRMLLFSNFNILPHHFPHDLHLKNNKVVPSIVLRLDNQGGVHRAALASPEAEALLRWRVYRQGRLVDQSSATNSLLYTPSAGAGLYVVMIVIEGPHGVMPVSNVMEYPLFPEPDGGCAIIPTDTDKDRLPDFLDASPEVPATGDLYFRVMDESFINPTLDRQLVRLWRRWTFRITTNPTGFPAEIGMIEETPKPRSPKAPVQ